MHEAIKEQGHEVLHFSISLRNSDVLQSVYHLRQHPKLGKDVAERSPLGDIQIMQSFRFFLSQRVFNDACRLPKGRIVLIFLGLVFIISHFGIFLLTYQMKKDAEFWAKFGIIFLGTAVGYFFLAWIVVTAVFRNAVFDLSSRTDHRMFLIVRK